MIEALVLITALAGFLGLLLRRNLFLKVLALDVMSTGVIGFFVLLAARSGVRTPILVASSSSASTPVAAFADPVPQAVILTAIVIGFSIQALLLVVITHLAQREPSLQIEALEEAAEA
ncbi:cation:proton antiporter subunit C [Synechococcus sp. CS-1329]|nr:cation:proton antiporter subunit C [Synechococcus sp. CS-1329]